MAHLVKGSVSKNQLNRRHIKDRKRELKISQLTALLVEKNISVRRFLEDMAEDDGIQISHHFRSKNVRISPVQFFSLVS